MYNLRSKAREGEYSPEQISYRYSSGDTSDKNMRVILNRIPVLENPSNHNCVFQVKNGKIVNKKNEYSGYREKIIFLLIFFGLFVSAVLLALYYKDERHIYRNYIRRKIVLVPNKLKSLNATYFMSSVYTKWNEIVRQKWHGSVLKNKKRSRRSKRRSDVCYNDIRDFIKEHLDSSEGKGTVKSLSFIEEQCMLLKLVPKTADYAQFSFNNTGTSDTDVNSLVDYASYDKGARILSTSGAESYVEYRIRPGILQYILGIKYFHLDELSICRISETLCRHVPAFVTGPFSLLQPWKNPGECWSFKGTRARVQIQLSERIFVTAVSLEHIPADFATTGDLRSAPAQFSIIGIDTEDSKFTSRHHLGTYRYLLSEPNIQTFTLRDEDSSQPYRIIEFNVESNHGNENYTCIYRLRVHGRPVNALQN